MVKHGIGLPRRALYVYVALTLLEVVTRRDDFPLSRFPMFSQTRVARPATRRFLTAVSDAGEQPLEYNQVRSLLGGDLAARVVWKAAGRKRDVRKQMILKLAKRIDSLRLRGRPRPYALRYYSQYFRGGNAVTKLVDAVYVPPPTLLERLSEEQRSTAAPLPPEKASHADHVVELDESHCSKRCAVVEDPLASAGSALRLAPSKRGRASAAFTLPAGSWFVLVRLRTKAAPPDDVVSFELESKRSKSSKSKRSKSKRSKQESYEIGNHKGALPEEGWVWSSSQPGWPALELAGAREQRVTLVARGGSVDIDQVWLSAKRSELPTWNAPVLAPSEEDSP
jgi:hypothetical protein